MHFRPISSVFSSDLAIDLGTANTCVFARGRGIVLNEPSIVAFNTRQGRGGGGRQEANEMLGRTPRQHPRGAADARRRHRRLRSDREDADYFVRKAIGRRFWCGRASSSACRRRSRRSSGGRWRQRLSGPRRARSTWSNEAMAAAIGAGLPVTEAAGNMVVDIGGGTTDIAVISMAGIVYAPLGARGGQCDGRRDHPAHAKRVQSAHRRAHGGDRSRSRSVGRRRSTSRSTMEVKGRHLIAGVPRTVTIGDGEIREALADRFARSSRRCAIALERIPPELRADIYDRGIVLTGGGALLRNLDRGSARRDRPAGLVAENPLTSVVLGAGKMLDDFKLLRKCSVN